MTQVLHAILDTASHLWLIEKYRKIQQLNDDSGPGECVSDGGMLATIISNDPGVWNLILL